MHVLHLLGFPSWGWVFVGYCKCEMKAWRQLWVQPTIMVKTRSSLELSMEVKMELKTMKKQILKEQFLLHPMTASKDWVATSDRSTLKQLPSEEVRTDTIKQTSFRIAKKLLLWCQARSLSWKILPLYLSGLQKIVCNWEKFLHEIQNWCCCVCRNWSDESSSLTQFCFRAAQSWASFVQKTFCKSQQFCGQVMLVITSKIASWSQPSFISMSIDRTNKFCARNLSLQSQNLSRAQEYVQYCILVWTLEVLITVAEKRKFWAALMRLAVAKIFLEQVLMWKPILIKCYGPIFYWLERVRSIYFFVCICMSQVWWCIWLICTHVSKCWFWK